MAFHFAYSLNGNSHGVVKNWPQTASVVYTRGDLLKIASGKAALATAAASDATILGICLKTVTAAGTVTDSDTVPVLILTGQEIVLADYAATTDPTSASYGTAYDITDEDNVNIDDTTGGFMYLVPGPNDGGIDSTNDKAYFRISAAKCLFGI